MDVVVVMGGMGGAGGVDGVREWSGGLVGEVDAAWIGGHGLGILCLVVRVGALERWRGGRVGDGEVVDCVVFGVRLRQHPDGDGFRRRDGRIGRGRRRGKGRGGRGRGT
jgi:hypothetical protein